jgi:hypothetical protein
VCAALCAVTAILAMVVAVSARNDGDHRGGSSRHRSRGSQFRPDLSQPGQMRVTEVGKNMWRSRPQHQEGSFWRTVQHTNPGRTDIHAR